MSASTTALIAYDGSDCAGEAVRTAAALLPGAEAIVLAVWEPAVMDSSLDPVGDLVGTVSGIYAELDVAGARIADELAGEGAERAAEAGLRARPVSASGRVWRAIVDAAEQHDADLVVVGARGRRRMESMLMGSVSRAVVQHSRRPVLVVPCAHPDAPPG